MHNSMKTLSKIFSARAKRAIEILRTRCLRRPRRDGGRDVVLAEA